MFTNINTESSLKHIRIAKGILISVLVLGVLLFNCYAYISPGYRGVCINLLKKEDVSDTSLPTGLHLLLPWAKVWKFPTFEQNVSWENKEAFRFQTNEGLASVADIGITFAIDPESVPTLFRKYRSGIREITNKFVKNYLRDAITVSASTRGIEDLYGGGKEKFLLEVQSNIQRRLGPLGINVSRVYLVDAFKFPDTVVNALNLKIEAAQRAEQRENELREAEAEARKQVADAQGKSESMLRMANAEANAILIRAQSQSEANSLINKTLTKDLVQYKAIESWDGKLPQTMAGESLTLFKNIGSGDG